VGGKAQVLGPQAKVVDGGTVAGHGAQVGLDLDDARPRRHAQITDGGSQVSPGGHLMAAAGALAGRRGIAPRRPGRDARPPPGFRSAAARALVLEEFLAVPDVRQA